MKKAMAIILAILLALSLFACQQNNTMAETSPSADVSPPAAETTSAETVTDSAEPETSSEGADTGSSQLIGFYDPSYDYTKNPRYKIVHMDTSTSDITKEFADCFEIWAERMNCDFTYWVANGDNDLYVNSIEIFAEQNYDGFLLAPDQTVMARVIDVAEELDIQWMTVGTYPVDDDGILRHPYVGMDNVQWGVDMANWLIAYQRENWPDAESSEIGMLSLDYSTVPLIHERTTGAQQVWVEEFPEIAESNFFIGDGIVTGRFDADTGYNITSPIISANPQIKYWLVAAAFDDYAQGAALAAASTEKKDVTVVIDCGGAGLIKMWDAGEVDSCWKAAVNTPQLLFSEGMIGGLYAFMSGQATPETLWPDWVNHSAGDEYADLYTTPFLVTYETYQEQMEFVDAYAGTDKYDYPYNGTTYTTIGEPPAYYNS